MRYPLRAYFSRGLCSFLIFLLVTPRSAWSVPHYLGAYPKHARDMIGSHLAPINRSGAHVIGSTTGTKYVAVLLVQFPTSNLSSPPTSGSRSIINLGNGTDDSYFTQMAKYYTEVSYGKMTINFKFFGPNDGGMPSTLASAAGAYTLTHPMEYYGCGDEGPGTGTCSNTIATPTVGQIRANGDYLIRDALNLAYSSHSNAPNLATSGASNGTTTFDAVVVMHAGNGNETTVDTPGDIWSIFYSQDASIIGQGNTSGFTEGDVVPETETNGIMSPLGVMCHEFGHELGLPDEYNTISGTSVVGPWELMDFGPYDGAGANPSHMGIWDKQYLGWASLEVITSTAALTLASIESSATAIKMPVQNGSSSEYFLLEYRYRSGGSTFDRSLPGDGLLIWHIDDNLTSARGISVTDPNVSNTVNSGNPHYGISIVTQDGLAAYPGDAGNAFTNNKNFLPPQSNNFAGNASGVSVVDISGVGSSAASLLVTNLGIGASQTILKVVNYPNPAGKGYPHPQGEGHTTIQFQVSRPAQDWSINIYTLSGDLVRKISKDQINLNTQRSANFKWIYEYVWDFTNGNGTMVGPGVYLYIVRVDGLTQTSKMVIIR